MIGASLSEGNNQGGSFLMFVDKILSCKECGRDFDFTASEQEFYAQKGFTNEPGRCPECRATQIQMNGNRNWYGQSERPMYAAVCATCGKDTTYRSSQRRQTGLLQRLLQAPSAQNQLVKRWMDLNSPDFIRGVY